MNKKTEPKTTFDDFMTKSFFDDASKMELYLNGKKTEHYLNIKGLESSETQRERIQAQVSFRSLSKELEGIDDEVDKIIREQQGVESIQIVHAASLIESWSFDVECEQGNKLKLLSENEGLASLVIGFSADIENYRKKK